MTDHVTATEDGPQPVETTSAVGEAEPVQTHRRAIGRPSRRGVARGIRGAFAGLSAVGTKELRGRMRGRRAFVILTVYLVLLAAFAWMMELILEQQHGQASASSAAFASASIGRGIFTALMMLETLLVVALAPAFTAGAISLEREKQTLDMLVTTPISSASIVVAKLFSALTYLFILIFASVPLTALVFVFGGVSPDDVVRGYLVLLATAIGLGALGLFFSALIKRTQAATIATYFGLLFVTLGAFFIFFFWNSMASAGNGRGVGPIQGRPPEVLVWLNPYFAQADIMCGVEDGFGEWCTRIAFVAEQPIFGGIRPIPVPEPGTGFGGDGVQANVQPFGVVRDSFWPKSAIAWLVLAGALIAASIQLVMPTRGWRLGIPRSRRRGRAAS
ncbi:MAG TPA: ABC transporter permease [Vitreimonas sp.]|nr:ABC transporter permease [Vitreimonas sp.]